MRHYFLYFVLFKSTTDPHYTPIVTYRDISTLKSEHSHTMHLFDGDLSGTLGAVEYIMHLPR